MYFKRKRSRLAKRESFLSENLKQAIFFFSKTGVLLLFTLTGYK